MDEFSLPSVPENWNDPAARAEFFAQLPKPLVVLIACDLASLSPHGALGLKAIDTVRLWLMGRVDKAHLRSMWEQIWMVMLEERERQKNTHRVALDAVLSAATADAAYWANDLCSPPTLDRDAIPASPAAHYHRHRRVVVEVLACAADPTVGRLLAVAVDDPRARPLFWDAMIEAGYAPIEPLRELSLRERITRRLKRLWKRER